MRKTLITLVAVLAMSGFASAAYIDASNPAGGSWELDYGAVYSIPILVDSGTTGVGTVIISATLDSSECATMY